MRERLSGVSRRRRERSQRHDICGYPLPTGTSISTQRKRNTSFVRLRPTALPYSVRSLASFATDSCVPIVLRRSRWRSGNPNTSAKPVRNSIARGCAALGLWIGSPLKRTPAISWLGPRPHAQGCVLHSSEAQSRRRPTFNRCRRRKLRLYAALHQRSQP